MKTLNQEQIESIQGGIDPATAAGAACGIAIGLAIVSPWFAVGAFILCFPA